jgi:anti-sigma factor ChrR (cupin superfamily)
MSSHQQHDSSRHDPDELAELYAAGALAPQELQELETRLAAGDADLQRALRRIHPAMESLLDVGTVAVPSHLRESIESAVIADASERYAEQRGRIDTALDLRGAQVDTDEAMEAGETLVIVRSEKIRWLPTGVPGVRFRTLSASRQSNRRTLLLKMDPHTALPDHDHAGVEEVCVISGELHLGDERLVAGDYFRVAPGARHPTPMTPGGCVCLVISDYQPFPLNSWFGFIRTMLRGLFHRPGPA